ncbi:MAG: FAD-dependent oxidoreductase, partial [Candidatus Omnitrophica bacterium]|nr:FAD-dependent oxidoreductase [Candidatus Omnitrophota bacterium]
MPKYDFFIIGAGIIGLTTAHALKTRKLSSRIIVIDKEEAPAF